MAEDKPIVVVTGAASREAAVLCQALVADYHVVGMDQRGAEAGMELIPLDLAAEVAVDRALRDLRDAHGGHLAAVVHLAPIDQYDRGLIVDGTRRLLDRLGRFRVDRFVLASTMRVQRAGDPIDEDGPIDPGDDQAAALAEAEAVVRASRGATPATILRLGRLYDDEQVDRPLAEQVAAIRERTVASRVHPGSLAARHAMLHRDDLADAVRRVVARRGSLPHEAAMLLGEPDPPSDGDLVDLIGGALHGEAWRTVPAPTSLVAAGGWLRSHLPAALGGGDQPRPAPDAGDSYVPDLARAAALLGWHPRRRIAATLPTILRRLKRDPHGWYAAHGIDRREARS